MCTIPFIPFHSSRVLHSFSLTVALSDVARVDLVEKQYRTSCRDRVHRFKESLEKKKPGDSQKIATVSCPLPILLSICAGAGCKCSLSFAVLPDVCCSTEPASPISGGLSSTEKEN